MVSCSLLGPNFTKPHLLTCKSELMNVCLPFKMCLLQICFVAFATAKLQNSHYSGHNYGAGRDWHVDSFHGDKLIQSYQGNGSYHIYFRLCCSNRACSVATFESVELTQVPISILFQFQQKGKGAQGARLEI